MAGLLEVATNYPEVVDADGMLVDGFVKFLDPLALVESEATLEGRISIPGLLQSPCAFRNPFIH